MLSLNEFLVFLRAVFAMVITPGPNMIYLISRSMTQGKKAGLISLIGVICGFLFHIVMVAFGLTAILLAVPFAFITLKVSGALYLLYMAYGAIKSGNRSIFETRKGLKEDGNWKLFTMGFLTNVLNPKMAIFYLSLFPQFIKPEMGSITTQCFQLGMTQMTVSFTVNFLIVLSASRAAPGFLKTQAGFAFKNGLWQRYSLAWLLRWRYPRPENKRLYSKHDYP